MADLHELITRGRFLFSAAPNRFETYRLINGKRTAKEIARITGRHVNNVHRDIGKLRDYNLIVGKIDKEGSLEKKDGYTISDKSPIMKHVPLSYFKDIFNSKKLLKNKEGKFAKKIINKISIPSSNEILDISKNGEDQLYEFKEPGVAAQKLTKEIAAFLHTKRGGIIFYGVDDDGVIVGSDVTKQVFDQKLQNSIRHTINPPPSIDIRGKIVAGYKLILIVIPPWNKKNLYQCGEKYYIRKGTNVFVLKPEEIQNLTRGLHIT